MRRTILPTTVAHVRARDRAHLPPTTVCTDRRLHGAKPDRWWNSPHHRHHRRTSEARLHTWCQRPALGSMLRLYGQGGVPKIAISPHPRSLGPRERSHLSQSGSTLEPKHRSMGPATNAHTVRRSLHAWVVLGATWQMPDTKQKCTSGTEAANLSLSNTDAPGIGVHYKTSRQSNIQAFAIANTQG